MLNIKNLTREQLVDNFVAGLYEYDSEEYLDASEAFHQKLSDVENLIPLLRANNKASQRTATYIASLEGDRARSIFPYIFELLESPWVEVRDEVCDCFTECATKGEQLISLFAHLKDSEQSIRLKVINVIACLKSKQIGIVSKYVETMSSLSKFKEGIEILKRQGNGEYPYKLFLNNMNSDSELVKIFSYAAATKELDDTGQLLELAKSSGVVDIQKHFDLYFGE